MRTLIIDCDGTLLEHIPDFENIHKHPNLRALPGAREKMAEWHCNGDYLIIVTARPESLRELTLLQLNNAGIVFNQLIMGVGSGTRVLINDYEEGKPHKAWAFNIVRNKDGLKDINI